MSAQPRTTADTDRIDKQIEGYIEERPKGTRLQDTTPASLLLHLSSDTPLELIGQFALAHGVCDGAKITTNHRRIMGGVSDE